MDFNDQWIIENSPISPEKFHAIGVISYRWNIAEVALKRLLIGATFGLDILLGWPVVHGMSAAAISTSIMAVLRLNRLSGGDSEEVMSAMSHGLRLYDVSRINRNQLTHYHPTPEGMGRLKGPIFQIEPIPNDVADLRRVADDIQNLLTYLALMSSVIHSRKSIHPDKHPDKHPLPVQSDFPLPALLWTGTPSRPAN